MKNVTNYLFNLKNTIAIKEIEMGWLLITSVLHEHFNEPKSSTLLSCSES